ncbi:transcriptional regulator [Paractinoplanes abujensis]|uniref:Sugar diacid utilization regulator n=1 Tax=Paractinoplanes abujensis TaxID=882441 RepID=A0A7W7CMJ5_9ACTN|nr:helix-turn-helix domain-containing protein [Actinoplanes abujensis]MBB4691277.1 sugar diacid utilization regulator [Actinoplanes abujensis]GID17308.1 transcriptional regulator [Actinoplanes abujensis]
MDLADLAGAITPNIRTLLFCVAERRLPAAPELITAAALGERRAIQGVPIEAVVTSWHRAEREVFTWLATVDAPFSPDEHRQVTRDLAAAVDRMTSASTEAYRRARTEVAAHLEQMATDLVSRLTGGELLDPQVIEERAKLIGVAVQGSHRALAVRGSQLLPREQRVVLDALRPLLHSRTVVGTRDDVAVIVTPDVPGLIAALTRAARSPGLLIGVGLPRPRFGEVAGSCREAMAAASAARRAGTTGVVEFAAVAADVLLLENPLDAQQVVSNALGPIQARPQLVETLRVYLHSGLSTRATAVALRLHENTVTYRLRQITDALHVATPAALVRADILMALRYRELS